MSDAACLEELIRSLRTDLRPVRRLPAPGWRALGWLAVVALLGVILAMFADLEGLRQRLASVPDMWLAVAGSTLTALLAAFAAFQTSMPDRDPRWGLLPIPAALVWLGASGMGCLRGWIVPGTHDASMDDMGVCATFIIGVSLPLSVLLVVMLRRACPIRPGLTALLAGLASASAAATLLNFFHPHDAAATDLLVHVAAMALVILANRWLGGRLIAR